MKFTTRNEAEMENIIGGETSNKIIKFFKFKDPQSPNKKKSIFCSDDDVINELKILLRIKNRTRIEAENGR